MSRPWSFEGMRFEFMCKKVGLFKRDNKILGISVPLGILYISSYLKQNGYDVKVMDGYFDTTEDVYKSIREEKPKIVGVSGWTAGWKGDIEFINNLKKEFPDILLVYGGPHAMSWKENCLKDCKALDFVVNDEGEQSMLELCNAIKNNTSVKKVKGISWRDDGKIIINEPMPYIKELDNMPFPDRDAVDMNRYIPAIGLYKKLPNTTFIGSRGCPYQCTFCHSSNVLRLRSAKNIVDEIEEIVRKYGIKDVLFYDETFTVPKHRCLEICDELIKRKTGIVWSANARVDCLDEEMLKKMKKAGCWRLLFGLESGVQKNLDTIKKGFTIEQARKAIKLTSRSGIESYAVFILGVPGETYEESMQTIKFACELPLDYAVFSPLSVLPGTEIYDQIKDSDKLDFSGMTLASMSSYVPDTMTREQIEYLMKYSYKKFYGRPKYILKRALMMRSFTDLKRNIIGFFSLFKK